MKDIKIERVRREHRRNYINYLLLADESEQVVMEYIDHGDMFAIYANEEGIGVMLFTYLSDSVVELKNIAVAQSFRGMGVGKEVIDHASIFYAQKGLKKIVVGTANSSIANLAFYQKAGFRIVDIKRDFFLKYPEPIFEDDIQAIDMIMFEKELMERKY